MHYSVYLVVRPATVGLNSTEQKGSVSATDDSRAVPSNVGARVVAVEIDLFSAGTRTHVTGCAPVAMLGVNKRKARQAVTRAYRPIKLVIDLHGIPVFGAVLAEIAGNSSRCD